MMIVTTMTKDIAAMLTVTKVMTAKDGSADAVTARITTTNKITSMVCDYLQNFTNNISAWSMTGSSVLLHAHQKHT
jgi:oligoribonuclease (3'-5' exoribonuclease)